MGFPPGMVLNTIAFGIPLTATGKDVVTKVSVKPTSRVIWAATGQPLPEFTDSFTAEPGQLGQFQIPAVDQPGFIDSAGNAVTDFAYQITASWEYGNERPIPWAKNLKPLQGQAGSPIDLDLVPDGPVSIPVTAPTAAVLGFGGRTGFITLQESDLPERLSEGQLSATFVPRWKATTTYLAGEAVLNPNGEVVTAKVGFTSGASYDAANWNAKYKSRVLMNTLESNALDYTGPVALSTVSNTFRQSAAVNFTGTGSNGIRGDSIASDQANLTGTSFGTCNFAAVEGNGGFAGRGSIHGFQFRGIIAPHPEGDVYGEMGGFISTVTSNRKGALAEGAEIQARSNLGAPSRMAAMVAIAMEDNPTIDYWSRGVWSVSGGQQRAGEAFHASGAGWTYGFRYQNSANQDLFKIDQLGAVNMGIEQHRISTDALSININSNMSFAKGVGGLAEMRVINSDGLNNEIRFYNDAASPGLVWTNSIRASGSSMQLRAAQTVGHAKGAEAFNNIIEIKSGRRLGFFAATPIIQPTRAGQLTDSSGGTVSSVIAAISDPATRDAIASIVAKFNTLEAQGSAAAGGFGLTT